MTLKSHAPSFNYLENEADRLVGQPELNDSKIIVLVRDPRDVMISFYEYVKVKRNIEIDQKQFPTLEFFYASTIDKQFDRKLNVSPLNIFQAYRMFIKNWTTLSEKGKTKCQLIKYEDLVKQPIKVVSNVLDFIGQQAEIKVGSIDELVSLYSSEDRPRGQANGWKKVKKKYATLIDQVEQKLSKEIDLLGY